jgi:hypothetical protein
MQQTLGLRLFFEYGDESRTVDYDHPNFRPPDIA